MFEEYYSNKNNYGFSNILNNHNSYNSKNNNKSNNFFNKNENQKVFQSEKNNYYSNSLKKNKKNSNINNNNNNTIKQSSYDILNNNPFNKNALNFHKKKDGISDLLTYSNKKSFNNYNSKENFADELYGKNNPYQNSIRSSYPYYPLNKKKTPNKKINNNINSINNKDFFSSLPLPNYNNNTYNNNNYNNYNNNTYNNYNNYNNPQKNISNQNIYNKNTNLTNINNNILNNNNNNINLFPKTNLYSLNPSQPEKAISNQKFQEIESENIPEYFNTNCTIIKEYAYKEDQNSKFRNYMEDKGKCINNFNNSPNNILFCLFDGHGGHEVSTYLQKNFAPELKNKLQNVPKNTDLKDIFIELCKEIDEKLKNENFTNIGSTGCIIYITEENNKKILYCINLGDTRCVLLKENDYLRLSYDDRASDEEEKKRIISEGGMVLSGRVFGILMLSRAFGDWELKDYGVSNEAHVYKMEISDDCKNLVIASDGIWDVIKESELIDIRNKSSDSKDFCEKIMNLTVERESMDNLSCFVIKLN